METESRKRAWKIIYEFRAALYGSDLSDEDLDYIRDAFLMTIEQIKVFNARFRDR